VALNLLHGVQAVSGSAAGALVASVWQGLVLAAAIWLALKALPRAGAGTRFAIWMTGFGVAAVLPLARFAHADGAASAVLAHGPLLRVDVRWSVALAVIWLAASLYRAAGLVVNGWKIWGVWRRAVPVEVAANLSSLLMDGSRSVELCVSEELDRPSLIGFFASRIVIPRWLFEKLSETELRQIVMHEMEHLRRGDDWINLMQKVCLAVFPLNPVLVWMERRMCLERELACDAGVIRATGAPKAYAACLTTLAERSMDRRVASLALGAMERRSQLGERVYSILRGGRTLSRGQAAAVMSVAVVGLAAGAAELSRVPQLVSFVAPAPVASAAAVPLVTVGTGKITGANMQNVVYRDGAAGTIGAHETLLKVSDAVNAVAKAPAMKKTVHAKAAKKQVVPVEPKVMVISEWRQVVRDEMVGSRMIRTVYEEREVVRPPVVSSGFAVVRAADGRWLIFEL
jgi:BlaR1 peptidase M56